MPLPTPAAGRAPQGASSSSAPSLPAELPSPGTLGQGEVYTLTVPPQAHWTDRAVASIIDALLVMTPQALAILLAASASPDVNRWALVVILAFGAILTAAVWVGLAYLEGSRAQTLGKKLLGLVTVRTSDALVLGFATALRRNFLKLFQDCLPLTLRSREFYEPRGLRQTLSDKAVGSVVLYARRRQAPEEGN